VGLYVNVKCLRLQLAERWAVNARHSARRCQMVQVACQFSELSACHILLALNFFHDFIVMVLFQHFSHFFIFFFHVLKVLLARVKVMLVFAAVITAVPRALSTNTYYF
jgi:hypothetical protein